FHGSLNTGNKKQKEVSSPLKKNHSQHGEAHSPPTYNQYHHHCELSFTNAVDKMTTAITCLTKILEKQNQMVYPLSSELDLNSNTGIYIGKKGTSSFVLSRRSCGPKVPQWMPISFRPPKDMILTTNEVACAAYIFGPDLRCQVNRDEVLVSTRTAYASRASLATLIPGEQVIQDVIDSLTCILTQDHKKLNKLPSIWFLPTTFSTIFIERMLEHKSFYNSSEITVPRISEFRVVEPSDLPQQRKGSNDCGIWVAQWMKECGWTDDFGITVYDSDRMRLAIDLVSKEFNLKNRLFPFFPKFGAKGNLNPPKPKHSSPSFPNSFVFAELLFPKPIFYPSLNPSSRQKLCSLAAAANGCVADALACCSPVATLPSFFLCLYLALTTEPRTTAIVKGRLEGGQLYTPAYVARMNAMVWGAARGITVPTNLTVLWSSLQQLLQEMGGTGGVAVDGSFFQSLFNGLVKEGEIQGSVRAGIHWTQVNSFISYEVLHKLGIPQPIQFLQSRYFEGKPIVTTFVHQSMIDMIDAATEDAIERGSWSDSLSLLPSSFTPQDADKKLSLCQQARLALKSNKAHIFGEFYVLSSSFKKDICDRVVKELET
ncbi:hypothetical protein S83_035784, partial [Arachis hypogaea]